MPFTVHMPVAVVAVIRIRLRSTFRLAKRLATLSEIKTRTLFSAHTRPRTERETPEIAISRAAETAEQGVEHSMKMEALMVETAHLIVDTPEVLDAEKQSKDQTWFTTLAVAAVEAAHHRTEAVA